MPIFSAPAAHAEPLEISTANPAQGRYQIEASATVAGSPQDLARALVDFENQCELGCAVQIPSVDQNEVVDGSFDEGSMRLWTRIDDILDATYWTRVSVHRQLEAVEVRLSTPSDDELEAWPCEDRPHKPFFHYQEGVWSFRPIDGGTEVEYRMNMHSDRFMINLMPSQVLRGAELHTRQLFSHLRSLDTESPAQGVSPDKEQSSGS